MIIQNLFCHLLQHEGLVPKLSFILRPQLKRLLKNFGQQYILAGSTGPIFQAENFLVDWLVTTANGGLSLNVSLDDIKLTLVHLRHFLLVHIVAHTQQRTRCRKRAAAERGAQKIRE